MFGIFKSDPTKKLKKEHGILLEKAMHAQRNGDIRGYAMLTAETESVWQRIEQIESNNK
ncbi:DUF6435 family protein [Pseudoalteromonas luteoviolacea]|uniref:Lacal_2735 family protein n=1 Tax=Pseudoalteromonas luteoviolacea DSM 6061 TaxID=1365250 RepID=A0A166X6G4_9GAMM|nr:DUF6435 family protein [Pseudoalteromonas luteoviolacea]KZN39726.1 hypothetical protein N475_13280 [Pseudoalteromonas luteoviolacea DSM 6061]MBE0385658.1 hypothetical protein [Pseudoalteromonas luteoviolacea DSM 6061]